MITDQESNKIAIFDQKGHLLYSAEQENSGEKDFVDVWNKVDRRLLPDLKGIYTVRIDCLDFSVIENILIINRGGTATMA